MIIRLKTLCLALTVLIFTISSCTGTPSNPDAPSYSADDYFYFSPPAFDNTNDKICSADVTAKMVDTVYSAETSEFSVIISGSNTSDNALYVYEIPGLEKKVNDKWMPVPFSSDQDFLIYDDGFLWSYCTRPDSDVMWTTLTLDTKYLYDPISNGDYRLVIYLPDQILYAEFTIISS